MVNFLSKKKILILGGSGFVGTNLLIILKKKGYTKLTATYFSKKNFHKVHGVKYIKTNLNKISNLNKLTKEADIVFMLAAVSSGAKTIQNNPLTHFAPNIQLNLNALESCKLNNVRKFIFLSSNTVYPDSKKIMNESNLNYQLFDKYFVVGWMKIFSEIMCDVYSNRGSDKSLDVLIVRPSNLYGPFDKFSMSTSKVIAALIRKFHENKKNIEIWGDGKDLKDFMYIEDFCDNLINIASRKKHFEIINICSGKSITINKIINILAKEHNFNKKNLVYNSSKPSMIPVRKMSNMKLKREYKFYNNFNIKDGLIKTVNWYSKYFKVYNKY